ncbi:hypothetical protein K439DRAFT_1625583, partial [Ramaria rubella]
MASEISTVCFTKALALLQSTRIALQTLQKSTSEATSSSRSLETSTLKHSHKEEEAGPHKRQALEFEEPVYQDSPSPGLSVDFDFGNHREHSLEPNAGEDLGIPASEDSDTGSALEPKCEDSPMRSPSPQLSSKGSNTPE